MASTRSVRDGYVSSEMKLWRTVYVLETMPWEPGIDTQLCTARSSNFRPWWTLDWMGGHEYRLVGRARQPEPMWRSQLSLPPEKSVLACRSAVGDS